MKRLPSKAKLLRLFVLIGSLSFISPARLEQDLSKDPLFIEKAARAISRFANRPIISIVSVEKDKLSLFGDEYIVTTKEAGRFFLDENAEVVKAYFFSCPPKPNVKIILLENAKDVAEQFLRGAGINLDGFVCTRMQEPPEQAATKVYHFSWHQFVNGVKGPNWINVAVDAETGAIFLFYRWIERNITVPTKPNITEQQAIELAKKHIPFEIVSARAELEIWYDHRIRNKDRPQVLRWLVEFETLAEEFNLKKLQKEKVKHRVDVYINAISGEVYDVRY